MHHRITFILVLLAATTALAAPPEQRPVRPAPPAQERWNAGPTALRGSNSALQPLRSVFDRSSQLPTAWQRIQPDLDRSLGRLEDRATYELNRLEFQRRANAPNADPRLQRELFLYERERQLREQEIADRVTHARNREELLKNREYELWLNSGLADSVAAQAEADRRALADLKTRREQQLKDAGDNPAKRGRIEAEYQKERARILGVELEPGK